MTGFAIPRCSSPTSSLIGSPGVVDRSFYGLLALIVIAAAAYGVTRWRHKHSGEAEAAMGRANHDKMVRKSARRRRPAQENPVFSTQQERSQKAIEEFEKIAAKYGEPYRSEARYFYSHHELVTDRAKGETDLQALSQGSGEIATLAKFALAQAKEADGNLDEAAKLYGEIAKQGSAIVTPETANLRLAGVYDKQGKRRKRQICCLVWWTQPARRRTRMGSRYRSPRRRARLAQKLLKIRSGASCAVNASADHYRIALLSIWDLNLKSKIKKSQI